MSSPSCTSAKPANADVNSTAASVAGGDGDSNQSPSKNECTPCVKMLRQILTSSDARPRKILNALSSTRFVWRPTEDGLEVQIPTAVALPQRRWSRLHPPEQQQQQQQQQPQPSNFNSLFPATLQATSAGSPSSPQLIDKDKKDSNDGNNNHEWMQIICKPCANRGPEAGARAFVMGPTPLSMVVCNNRLQGTTPEAKVAEMEEILTHEFMHVYDVRQMQLDLRDCETLAYSEVRAARQAECATSWTPQACTRVKAQTATQNLFPTMGASCIRTVWGKAYRDTRPFGEKPAASASSATTKIGTENSTNKSNANQSFFSDR